MQIWLKISSPRDPLCVINKIHFFGDSINTPSPISGAL
jgi:hypothetical protein